MCDVIPGLDDHHHEHPKHRERTRTEPHPHPSDTAGSRDSTIQDDTAAAQREVKLATELHREQSKSPDGYITEADILANGKRFTRAGDAFVKVIGLDRHRRHALALSVIHSSKIKQAAGYY